MTPIEDRITLPHLAEALGISKHLVMKEMRENGMPCLERPQSRGGDYVFSKVALLRWSFARMRMAPALDVNGERLDKLDPEAELARLRKEQADKAELDNGRLRKELVARPPLESALAGMDASLKDRLMMVPTSAAPEALTAGETAGIPGIAEVYRRHIGQALSDVAAAKLVSTIDN